MLNLSNAESGPKPAMIIGIEQDVGTLRNWHSFWPRPLGMVQWTMASTRGHPILIDTMRRVSEAVERISVSTITGHGQTGAARDLWSVIETSGPAAFTDATLRCKERSLVHFREQFSTDGTTSYGRSRRTIQCDLA